MIVIVRFNVDEYLRSQASQPSHTFALVVGSDENFTGTLTPMDFSMILIIQRRHFKIFIGNNSTISARIKALGISRPNTARGQVADPAR